MSWFAVLAYDQPRRPGGEAPIFVCAQGPGEDTLADARWAGTLAEANAETPADLRRSLRDLRRRSRSDRTARAGDMDARDRAIARAFDERAARAVRSWLTPVEFSAHRATAVWDGGHLVRPPVVRYETNADEAGWIAPRLVAAGYRAERFGPWLLTDAPAEAVRQEFDRLGGTPPPAWPYVPGGLRERP